MSLRWPCTLSHIIPICAGIFLTTQRTLLTLQHLRCAFIKLLQLHVPQVLRRDVDPVVGILLELGKEFSRLSLSFWYKYYPNTSFTSLEHSHIELAHLFNLLMPSQISRACPRRLFFFCISLYKLLHLFFHLLFFSPRLFLLNLLSFSFNILAPPNLL